MPGTIGSGRNATPTKVLEMRGSWRAKARQGEPRGKVKVPPMPKWLEGEEKVEWKRLTRLLREQGLIAEVDRGLVALYCEAWAEFIECCVQIRQEGRLVKGCLGNQVINPLILVKQRAADRMVKLADRFGFSPAARTRIRVEEAKDAADPREKFFDEAV
jgi:P27 family predicted phage terminase small subunit